MSISPHLSRKLQEALGQEASEDLVSWMGATDSLRGDVAELRQEMRVSFERLTGKLEANSARLETLIERRTADLMKWSFVFWVSAVGAIAALAGVLK